MNPPIDPVSAGSAMIAQLGKAGGATKASSISPINFEKFVHVARIETDDMIKWVVYSYH
jgi:hypothetical protein